MDRGQRTVVWTPSARDCLDEILQFIATDSPASAEKVLGVILAAAESLSMFAERGRIVPELGDQAIREIFVYRFRLMYQVASNDVRTTVREHLRYRPILPAVHRARNHSALLFK